MLLNAPGLGYYSYSDPHRPAHREPLQAEPDRLKCLAVGPGCEGNTPYNRARAGGTHISYIYSLKNRGCCLSHTLTRIDPTRHGKIRHTVRPSSRHKSAPLSRCTTRHTLVSLPNTPCRWRPDPASHHMAPVSTPCSIRLHRMEQYAGTAGRAGAVHRPIEGRSMGRLRELAQLANIVSFFRFRILFRTGIST